MPRKRLILLTASLCVVALAGCDGREPSNKLYTPADGQGTLRSEGPLSTFRRTAQPKAKYPGLKDLYVARDESDDVVLLANGTYKPDGKITKGISNPLGDWLDAKGNLYVANGGAYSVPEYKPKATNPTFTYTTTAPYLPDFVTTDTKGNVYVATNGGYKGPGPLNEYAQGVDKVIYACSQGGTAAVDSSGDVFVAYVVKQKVVVGEYKGGLKGCKVSPLGVKLSGAAGMVLDKKGDLVVCDPGAKTVDVVAPPYESVTRTLGSGYTNPNSVTLSQDGKTAFVTDYGREVIYVIDYSSGAITKKITSVLGPTAAVDGPNAVY